MLCYIVSRQHYNDQKMLGQPAFGGEKKHVMLSLVLCYVVLRCLMLCYTLVLCSAYALLSVMLGYAMIHCVTNTINDNK